MFREGCPPTLTTSSRARWMSGSGRSRHRSVGMETLSKRQHSISTGGRRATRRSLLLGVAGVAGGAFAVAGGIAARGGSGNEQLNAALAAQAELAATPSG